METEQIRKEIRDLFKEMNDIARMNHPNVYMMPIPIYNEINKKIAYLERALNNSRESNKNKDKMIKELKSSESINKANKGGEE